MIERISKGRSRGPRRCGAPVMFPALAALLGLILVAGAGILETSKNKGSAERFLTFLLSPAAQQYFAEKTFEYPVIEGVKIPKSLSPLSEIRSPKIMMTDMTDLKGTLKLLRKSGVLP